MDIVKYRNMLFFSIIIFFTVSSDEKLLFAVITSYNNAQWAKENLDSVFCQDYQNYHVIYIDDASTDKTAGIVKNYLKDHNLEDKCTVIVNEKRCWKLINIYNAYHIVPDDAIIVQIDGDDQLAHNKVFKKISQIYQDENIWMTYGQFKNKNGKMGYCKPIPLHISQGGYFRKWDWVLMHLRTFYAWLFKAIKIQDLFAENVTGFRGKFYPYANDNAMMYPMIEMARNHFKFVSEVLYIRNLGNPLSGLTSFRELQRQGAFEIRSKLPYSKVDAPIIKNLDTLERVKPDVIVVANHKTIDRASVFNNIKNNLLHIGNIFLINNNSIYLFNDNFELTSLDINFQEIYDILSDFVVLTNDIIVIEKNIDCNHCIQELERTHAYAFYCGLSAENMPFNSGKEIPFQEINEDLCAWKFKIGHSKWKEYHNYSMTLYRKNILHKIFMDMENNLKNNFLGPWKNEKIDLNLAGLFFKEAKVKFGIS